MGCKYHYLYHALAFSQLWGIGIGALDEQSVESYHKILNRLRRRYLNQRGIKRIQFLWEELVLITSPKYRK